MIAGSEGDSSSSSSSPLDVVVKSPRPSTSSVVLTKDIRIMLTKCDSNVDVSSQQEPRPPPPLEIRTQTVAVKCREKQLKMFQAMFGKGDLSQCTLPGSLILWGAPATGKTFTLERVLEDKDVHVIRMHSSEILCGRRAFYETFVKQFVSRTNKLPADFKCDSLQSLYFNIDEYLHRDEQRRFRPVVVVIKAAEGLKGEYKDILSFFVSLQDITQCNICVVLASTLPPVQFMPTVLDHSIIPVHFPQYTEEELQAIIIEHNIPRDVRKLLGLTKAHWESFARQIESSEETNYPKLWKKLEPQLKAQFFKLNTTVTTGSSQKDEENTSKTLELPLNAKYLIIASYLATHNPPSSDKRFFVKSKLSKAKRSRGTGPVQSTSTDKQEARSFELNRLNAIFGSVQTYCNDGTVNKNRNTSFMSLLTTLCQNKFLQHLGEDSSGNEKYKCLLDYETVLEISRSVDFELDNYLYRLL